METAPIVTISLNGEPFAVSSGSSLTDLLSSLAIDPARVALELNRRIVKRADWPATFIEAGAEVEVVQFVGGG